MTEPGRELLSTARDDSTPLPMSVDGLGGARPAPGPPTVESVLLAIAASGGSWFASRYAAEAGVPRDALDEPLAELRLAGLVRVAEWVRGVGQGYALTPEGEATAADPAARAKLVAAGASAPPARAASGADPSDDPAQPATGPGVRPPSDTDLTFAPPVVVPALLIANAIWFFVCAVYSIRWGLTLSRALSEGHPEVLHRFGAVSGLDLLAGEWWRLLTSCFVHIGALHLLGNLFALAMLGPLAELLWGRKRLVVIYLVSGLAGSALAMALRPDSILAGASGAIWGIQMSLFAWLFTYRKYLPADLASDWFRRLCVVFALNAGVSFLPQVSWEGHLGGGLAGFLVAGLLNVARFGDRPRRAAAWALIALLPVLCVGALVAAMDAKGMPGWQHLRQRVATHRENVARAEQRQKARAAEAEFIREVVPRLAQLAPLQITPQPRVPFGLTFDLTAAELSAVMVLKDPKPPAGRVRDAREQLRAQRAVADEVTGLASGEPTGNEGFDQRRARVRALAAARARALELLVALLDTRDPPGAPAWETWHAARAEADRMWVAFVGGVSKQ